MKLNRSNPRQAAIGALFALLLTTLMFAGCTWGIVVDADTGQPLGGATVRITDSQGKVVVLQSVGNGVYSTMEGLSPGTATFEVSAPGYQTVVETREIGADDEVTRFTLSRFPGTTSPTATATSSPAPTATPSPPESSTIIWEDWGGYQHANIDGYARQAGISIDREYSGQFDDELRARLYGGAVVMHLDSRDEVDALYDFVRLGGRAVVMTEWEYTYESATSSALQTLFAMSVGTDEILYGWDLPSVDGGAYTPLWSGFDLGWYGSSYRRHFLIPDSTYSCGTIVSMTSGLPRCVAAWRQVGAGEVLFLAGLASSPNDLCWDGSIDWYDNADACLQLVRYLVGEIDYPAP